MSKEGIGKRKGRGKEKERKGKGRGKERKERGKGRGNGFIVGDQKFVSMLMIRDLFYKISN